MDNSDIIDRDEAERCCRSYLPLNEQASQILERWPDIEKEDRELNERWQQHKGLISSQGYPQYLRDPVTGQEEREPHWAVADEIERQRTRIRAAPRELCESTLAWLRNSAKVLPEAAIERFEAKIDPNYIKRSCLTIRDEIKEEIDGVKRKVQGMKEEADALAKAKTEQPGASNAQAAEVPVVADGQRTSSIQRGPEKHKYTQYILDRWDQGERNREAIYRKFKDEGLPASKRRTEQEARKLFNRWWANAARHRPEMWSQSRVGAN